MHEAMSVVCAAVAAAASVLFTCIICILYSAMLQHTVVLWLSLMGSEESDR